MQSNHKKICFQCYSFSDGFDPNTILNLLQFNIIIIFFLPLAGVLYSIHSSGGLVACSRISIVFRLFAVAAFSAENSITIA